MKTKKSMTIISRPSTPVASSASMRIVSADKKISAGIISSVKISPGIYNMMSNISSAATPRIFTGRIRKSKAKSELPP